MGWAGPRALPVCERAVARGLRACCAAEAWCALAHLRPCLPVSQERFKKIARAYETLSDSKARREHDEEMGIGDSLKMRTAFSFG